MEFRIGDNMILFSASTMGFYDTDIHTVDGIPKDAKEISRELRDEMVKGQSQAQLIADENGYPSLQEQ
ncbi:hypothetical protein ACEU6F_22490 [Aeromonas salmonicida]|uniref:hypothetical protein n=1 Tax=Aeromonas salmonicida TaxID=645 RepID=UPI0035A6C681